MKNVPSARLAALAGLSLLLVAASPYEWPLRESPMLTSTYGEYRTNHFHGGIDLSTEGRIGIPVVAVEDGTVERVRASGSGYGKVIYLRLSDGRTAVYGHLSEFAPSIAAYVESAEDSLGRFEVDLYPPAGRLPARRGEIIAYSGQSGAGPAHFHFEMRQGDDGLNPLVHGFAVEDRIPPSILEIDLVPLDGESRAAGSPERRMVWPVAAKGSRTATEAPVSVRGRLGVSVRARDRAPGRTNRLGIFEADALVDGRLFYSCRFDSASWLRTQEVDAAYDFDRVLAGRNDTLRLWRLPGTKAHIYGGEGRLDADELEPGVHVVEIVIADAAGNTARRTFRIVSERTPEPRDSALGDVSGPRDSSGAVPSDPPALEGGLPLRLDVSFHGRYLEARLSSSVALAATPSMRLESHASSRALTVEAAGANVYRATFTPGPDDVEDAVVVAAAVSAAGRSGQARAPLPVHGIAAGRGGRIDFDGGAFVIRYEPSSFFGDALIAVTHLGSEKTSQGLVLLNAPYRIEPKTAVLDTGIVVGMPLPESARGRAGIYRRDPAGWVYAGASFDSVSGLLSARVRRLGEYAVLRDDAPPSLYNVRPAPGTRTSARPMIAAKVGDAGSGITAATLDLTLDGHPVIAEYDPEARSFTAHLRGALAPGLHEARFEAADRAGNRTVRTTSFRVLGAGEGGKRR